ncbi:MAG: toll/interleukin-1 receptor domain-containing protein, partial [Burkholderiales bacterium]|nr:toll/interleukin-1 receptor domain-containing protein [Burkholderiales bacterium]
MASAFISYCHADQGLRSQLDVHLAVLKRQGHVEVWSDHCIRPGEALDTTISAALEAADLVLLLVSPDFMNSHYCVGVEMTRALERAAAGESQVVSI